MRRPIQEAERFSACDKVQDQWLLRANTTWRQSAKNLKYHLFLVLTIYTNIGFAQIESDGSMIISGHVGRLLPNQVPNVTEILPLWGLRLGFPMDGGEHSKWKHFGKRRGRQVEQHLYEFAWGHAD